MISLRGWQAKGSMLPLTSGHAIFHRAEPASAKPALLLLHGFPTSSIDFHALWDELAKSFRVITVDFLGYGFSAKPRDASYAVASYANQAETVLRDLDVREYHVLSHDLGVTVMQELLAREAKLLSSYVLNGGIYPELHRPRAIQTLLGGPAGPLLARITNRRIFGKGFSEVFGPATQPSKEDLDALWEQITLEKGQHLHPKLLGYMRERREKRARWVGALEATRVPLGFCYGMADPVSGGHVAEHVHGKFPRAPLTELAGIGHYPQLEAPRAVLDAFAAFQRTLS